MQYCVSISGKLLVSCSPWSNKGRTWGTGLSGFNKFIFLSTSSHLKRFFFQGKCLNNFFCKLAGKTHTVNHWFQQDTNTNQDNLVQRTIFKHLYTNVDDFLYTKIVLTLFFSVSVMTVCYSVSVTGGRLDGWCLSQSVTHRHIAFYMMKNCILYRPVSVMDSLCIHTCHGQHMFVIAVCVCHRQSMYTYYGQSASATYCDSQIYLLDRVCLSQTFYVCHNKPLSV